MTLPYLFVYTIDVKEGEVNISPQPFIPIANQSNANLSNQYNSTHPNAPINPSANTTNLTPYNNGSSTAGNTSIANAANQSNANLNNQYNSTHPNNPVNSSVSTVNLNSSDSTSSISSTATNGGNNSSANGNSPEAAACSKQAKEQWENTPEYDAYRDNLSVTEFQQRYALLAQIKLVQITLQNCSSYLTPTEVQAYNGVITQLQAEFTQLGGYNGLTIGK